ncbi:MAG: Mov34/MPN/PAD-1 family protein [Thermoplasmatota archaeon]
MGSVVLRNQAFVNILVSSLEVYKKEAYGVLLGRRSGKDYIVRHAFTYQSARRHYDWVVMEPRRQSRIDRILRYLMDYRFIGDYHSHIDWPDHLSEADKREMRELDIPISLLLLVKDARRRARWRFLQSDRSLTGTVGDRYFIKLYAYEYDPRSSKIKKLRILCPFVHRLNRDSAAMQRLALFLKRKRNGNGNGNGRGQRRKRRSGQGYGRASRGRR